MIYNAVTLGYAVPEGNFDARVHSVFQSSANLEVRNGTGLLTLTSGTHVDLPQGIRVVAPRGLDFKSVKTDASACYRNGLLQIEGAAWSIDLRAARRWRCDLPGLNVDLEEPSTARAWEDTWIALTSRQRREGMEIVAEELLHVNQEPESRLAVRAGPVLRELLAAARRLDEAAIPTVEDLLGLGGGLTPSGDDLLVGFLAGLWCTLRGMAKRAQYLEALGRAVSEGAVRTNDISRTYLQHAVRGQVSSQLEAAARAIGAGEPQQRFNRHVNLAAEIGHASGLEGLTGLLLGLAAWDGEYLKNAP